MIEITGLEKSFGTRRAASGIHLKARDGEVTALLGPNGAGKTTTLRLLSGLMKADAGRALIDGVDAQKEPERARQHLGLLPDARGLYPRLTSKEHIEYAGRLYGLSKEQVAQNLGQLTKDLGLKDILHRRTHGFSQGERVKVALARAIVHKPQNIVLDEPTNGLDVGATRAMRRLIREMKKQGRCVIFASHIMQEVSALCDRIVIISKGSVVANGTPAELIDQSGQANLEDAFVFFTGIDDLGETA